MVFIKIKGVKKRLTFPISEYKEMVSRLLEILDEKESELSILLTTDSEIRKLNKKYFNKDKPTNVISFSFIEDGTKLPIRVLGDIIISVETAQKEAEALGKNLMEHLLYLTIHGLLHILGYDHKEKREAKLMEKRTEELLRTIKKWS